MNTVNAPKSHIVHVNIPAALSHHTHNGTNGGDGIGSWQDHTVLVLVIEPCYRDVYVCPLLSKKRAKFI